MIKLFKYLGFILAVVFAGGAIAPAGAAPRISLLTQDAGKEIYELEGHAALRIVMDDGRDMAVNWGVFDFTSPNFAYRFTAGQTDYLCVMVPTDMLIAEYAPSGRQFREQVLDLTPTEAARVIALVEENLRPENRTYRYNYVLDNCATRPYNIIRRALNDSITLSIPETFTYSNTGVTVPYREGEQSTFRKEMTRYHHNYPWYQFGINMALGSGIDRPITELERGFSPLYLHELMAGATGGFDNRRLVTEENVLIAETGECSPLGPTPWYLTPMAFAIALLVVTTIVTVRDVRRMKVSRWFDSALYSLFFVAGMLLTFLIFVSVHEATSPNWLYLWLNPFCIIPVIFEWIKSCRRVVYCYQFCNFAALVLLLAGIPLHGQAFDATFPVLIACDLMRALSFIYIYRKTYNKRV